MKCEQWKEILRAINEQRDLSQDNVIKKIKERLNAYPEEYQKWKGAGFDLNHRFEVEYSRLALLHLAAINGFTKVGKLLIEKEADVDEVNQHGSTPLHYAAENGHTEIANALIERGAIIDAHDGSYRTSLTVAVEYRHVEVAKVLIRNGADIKQYYNMRRCPWAEAIYSSTDMIKLLMENGADINVTYEESTILERIVRQHRDIYEFVIDHIEKLEAEGLDVNATNLRLKDRLKSRICIHNHRPLISVISQGPLIYSDNAINEMPAFLEENDDRFKVEFGNYCKSPANFIDLEDVKKRHVPSLELTAFAAETMRINAPRRNLNNPNAEQHQIVGQAVLPE